MILGERFTDPIGDTWEWMDVTPFWTRVADVFRGQRTERLEPRLIEKTDRPVPIPHGERILVERGTQTVLMDNEEFMAYRATLRPVGSIWE